MWTVQLCLSCSGCTLTGLLSKHLSNKNATENIVAGKTFKSTELTEDEMYQYTGITLYMGNLKLPMMRDFWCHGHRPLPHLQLEHSYEWPCERCPQWQQQTDDHDCLHRICPLCDSLLCTAFLLFAVYHLQHNLSVGERMVATKDRIAIAWSST